MVNKHFAFSLRKHIAAGLVLLLAASCGASAVDPAFTDRVEAEIDSREVYTGRTVDDISGVLAIYENDREMFSRAYGYAEISHGVRNTANTRFRIASVSKPVTAMAVLRLADAGKVDLKEKISAYLPQAAHGDRITVEQVLSHTAGLIDVFAVEDYQAFALRDTSLDEKIAYFGQFDLVFEPGADWGYSNVGYFILARLIEVVSGQSYADYVADAVFKPLGMNDSGSDHENKIIPGLARGYVPTDDEEIVYPDHFSMTNVVGAGSLYSTTHDLNALVQAIKQPGFLKEETLEDMLTPRATNVERLNGDGYGLGWRIGETNGRRRISHSGGIQGYLANVDWFVDDNKVAITLTNSQSLGFLRGRDALRAAIAGGGDSAE